ncbi:uncharacterized protein LOC128627262 [Artibeus jamaicensis]|uniref:uncharacterized protein LOC128627262 n=1 Tax=Artibeus jamaicensis TaxID=9417 RepID=UPI00235AF2DB|nr:uncharacterized protein LOC128627262 [Artibeus jamaicensis]
MPAAQPILRFGAFANAREVVAAVTPLFPRQSWSAPGSRSPRRPPSYALEARGAASHSPCWTEPTSPRAPHREGRAAAAQLLSTAGSSPPVPATGLHLDTSRGEIHPAKGCRLGAALRISGGGRRRRFRAPGRAKCHLEVEVRAVGHRTPFGVFCRGPRGRRALGRAGVMLHRRLGTGPGRLLRAVGAEGPLPALQGASGLLRARRRSSWAGS